MVRIPQKLGNTPSLMLIQPQSCTTSTIRSELDSNGKVQSSEFAGRIRFSSVNSDFLTAQASAKTVTIFITSAIVVI